MSKLQRCAFPQQYMQSFVYRRDYCSDVQTKPWATARVSYLVEFTAFDCAEFSENDRKYTNYTKLYVN